MTRECGYGFGANLPTNFDETVAALEKLLEKRGFRVFTRLNMQDIVGHEVSKTLGRYVILGACNRIFAEDLFQADPDIGLLMPCNIIVYEQHQGSRVMVKDPARIIDLVSQPLAIQAAINVKEQLEQVVVELQRLTA